MEYEFQSINFFSLWGFIWFLLFYFKLIDFNPSILYIFLFFPILYLVSNVILHKKNNKNKVFILICFFITDIFPIIYLILNNKVVLQFKSFILAIILLLIYLVRMKKNGIDINKIYAHFVFNKKYIN